MGTLVALLVDIGSTYTKMRAVDLVAGDLVGTSCSPSTVATDVTVGVQRALEQLKQDSGIDAGDTVYRLACSSAAGGLRVAVSGLVKSLTTEAAKKAAFGVGAKILGVYSYRLTTTEIRELENTSPDVLMLAGGIDGGNRDVLRHNAAAVAQSSLGCPVVLAGNKEVGPEAKAMLEAAGKSAIVVDNVMPELDQLNIEPVRTAIRELFIRHIVRAKGLDRVAPLLGGIRVPTPLAVLRGAQLLAQGVADEAGLGPLVVVDVGGATVDVDSIGDGKPTQPGVVYRGLPEPYDKRTVEGDLGIRYNSVNILELVGRDRLAGYLGDRKRVLLEGLDLSQKVGALASHVDYLPKIEDDFLVDAALASAAVDVAVGRHAGRIEEVFLPTGRAFVQTGKDLSAVAAVIGTGGIFAYGREPESILRSTWGNAGDIASLRPRSAQFFVDDKYLLFAAGLLSSVAPEKALRLMKKNLRRLDSSLGRSE